MLFSPFVLLYVEKLDFYTTTPSIHRQPKFCSTAYSVRGLLVIHSDVMEMSNCSKVSESLFSMS